MRGCNHNRPSREHDYVHRPTIVARRTGRPSVRAAPSAALPPSRRAAATATFLVERIFSSSLLWLLAPTPTDPPTSGRRVLLSGRRRAARTDEGEMRGARKAESNGKLQLTSQVKMPLTRSLIMSCDTNDLRSHFVLSAHIRTLGGPSLLNSHCLIIVIYSQLLIIIARTVIT